MEPYYIPYDEFWEWFNRVDTKEEAEDLDRTHDYQYGRSKSYKTSDISPDQKQTLGRKRPKTETKPRNIYETEAAVRADCRYVILYGRHKPGKKSKVWEGDGYLTMVGRVAHLSDLKGKLLEEPTLLDDFDASLVEDLGELMIGNTEIQVIELDKR